MLQGKMYLSKVMYCFFVCFSVVVLLDVEYLS